MLRLPDELRGAFKDPLGPVYTDPEDLVAAVGEPLIAVGDVVTYHLNRVDRTPDVALVDGRTERQAVDERIDATLGAPDVEVTNEPGTLSADLLEALRDAIGEAADGERILIYVDGEEDLATLPAILAAPTGASVVYGQPGEGMVLVSVTAETRATARELLSRMGGDSASAIALLE